MGVDAMIESIDLVNAGNAPRVEQDHSKSTYESWFKKELAEIDWSKPVDEVYNLIRGANPAPGAWTTLAGKKVDVYDSAKVDGSGEAGTVTKITDEGFVVAANGGQILVKRIRPEGEGKIAASEFKIDKGAKLGS
jgi:methionyl-tRNA formyltransferase